MVMSGSVLTRKQRNRIAADRSRRKRQEEHSRLKERVKELEIVNELLRRENERLAAGYLGSTDALLSPSDLLALRRLTAPCHAPRLSRLAPATATRECEGEKGESSSSPPLVNSCESNGDERMSPLLNPATTFFEETIDSATTTPTNVTAIETLSPINLPVTAQEPRETGGNFKPAALEKPLQKEPRPSLVSLRRNILAAMMTPKIVVSLHPLDANLARKRVINILLGTKNTSTRRSVTRFISSRPSATSSKNRLLEAMALL